MAQLNKFYLTEGRSVVYAKFNDKLKTIVENWEGTTEVKVKGKFIFITDRAFNYVPEILDANATPYEIVEVSKDQEAKVKRVLKALDKSKIQTLEGEDDWGDRTSEVNSTLSLELDDDIYIEVSVSASGRITGDGGDYWTPPSYETEWGDIELDELKIWIDEDEVVDFNEVQEQAILDLIEQLIELK